MFKKICRIVLWGLVLFAVLFIIFAMTHPELSFPWGNNISYIIYAGYLVVVAGLAIAAHKK